MDILLNIIGLSFIPLMLMLVLSGLNEIYQGLREHYQITDVKLSEVPLEAKSFYLVKNQGLRKLNIDFCSMQN